MKMGRLYNERLVQLFGKPRTSNSPITKREKDIAKSTQKHFEKAASNCIRNLKNTTNIQNLVLSGGCALNGVMNSKILRDFPVDKMYIQSAASDDGTAIGAAFHCWHTHLKKQNVFI